MDPNNPSLGELLQKIESMTDDEKEKLKNSIRENMQFDNNDFLNKLGALNNQGDSTQPQLITLLSLITLVLLILVFFGYKLYKSLSERERRREEKRRQKQQKKKK